MMYLYTNDKTVWRDYESQRPNLSILNLIILIGNFNVLADLNGSGYFII